MSTYDEYYTLYTPQLHGYMAREGTLISLSLTMMDTNISAKHLYYYYYCANHNQLSTPTILQADMVNSTRLSNALEPIHCVFESWAFWWVSEFAVSNVIIG